jgi:hypothetical protein|tara:strand:+ start:124 stop:447 length:324 start_codon:yes stop_codon:yes gene_type:complete
MTGIYAEWNPKLMEVFTPAQLEQLDNVFMYLRYENDIAYQNSMYEAVRDDGTEPEDDEPETNPEDVKDYYILEQIHRQLKIYHESDTLPDDFFTNPKYSCNSSNRSI